MDLKIYGAFAFGMIIGWYLYYINRYRKGDVQISDITTVVGTIGGAAVLKLFDSSAELFGAYGIGLAVGFFLYFLILVILVGVSDNFNADWFLDGRRRNPGPDYGYGQDVRGTVAAMNIAPPEYSPRVHGQNPGTVQNFYLAPDAAKPAASALAAPPARVAPPTMAAPNPNSQKVIDTCKAVWLDKKDACNYFAIEVARQLSVTLSGTADQIVDEIKGTGWTSIENGPAARDAATQGKFVIAGIKSGDFTEPRHEGHVAVVVAGAMNPAGWAPAGYWGSTDSNVASKGGSGAPISQCFRAEDKDKIVYASRSF
ncbi:hypothetical protein ABIA85_006572 [Bradyrhizobium sp. LA6.10]|uniref:hypothetical protein n=1 Tax=Bradyrhizobium sp. LA6.10 TaxID=3156318 RepID=UPI00339873D2